MVDVDEFERWMAMATDARRSAEAQRREGYPHWACFLCEQAAQFAVKALLHGVGSGAFGHDLVDLGARMAEATAEPLTDQTADILNRLSRHYIATRYPDAHPAGTPAGHYGAGDADTALADADAVLEVVARRWRALRNAVDVMDGGGDGR